MNPQTLVFILVAPLLLNAVHAEVPNIFQTNTPALASEVNANFSNLDMKIQNNQKKVSIIIEGEQTSLLFPYSQK